MNGKEWIQSAESNRGKLPDADYPKNIELLARAMECWDNLAGFRSDRERNKRFTYPGVQLPLYFCNLLSA